MQSQLQTLLVLLLAVASIGAANVISTDECNESTRQRASISLSIFDRDANSTKEETFFFSELKPELLKEVMALLKQESTRQENIGETAEYAARNCSEIRALKPCKSSGVYWVMTEDGVEQQYCNFDTPPPEWRLLINVDMTKNLTCPEGLQLVNAARTKNKRLCTGDSITIPAGGTEYSQVRGRVIGYQFSTTNAFGVTETGIDRAYVDGVSITHGYPRHHIWTYAAGYHNRAGRHACPCSNPNLHYSIPEFVGDNYYCDVAPHGRNQRRLYLENPLWDGEGCEATTTCCDNPELPWFVNKLPHSTSDDIELRILTDEGEHNEDVFLEVIEIYVK